MVLMTVERLGKYQLYRRFATGGMAELFLARHSGPGGFEKTVVIKRLFQNLAQNEDLIEMFLQEARIAARLNHPNCVQIYDLGEEEGLYFIAMEYIEGPDLMAIQRRARRLGRPIPIPLVVYIMSLVCRGLHHAHELRDNAGKKFGIVHRDVSPHNVLVTYNGDVKLVDFGVAKATTHAAATQAGVLRGKFAYMSPEHCESSPLDARADVFSAGILLHELLTQRQLFRRETDFATMRAVMEDLVPLPSSIIDEIPAGLDDATLKALHRDRDQRYQNAQELQLALETTIRERGWRTGPMEVAAYINELFPDHDTPYGKSDSSNTNAVSNGSVAPPVSGSLLGGDLAQLDETHPDGPQGTKPPRTGLGGMTSFLNHSSPAPLADFDDLDGPTTAAQALEQPLHDTSEVPLSVPPPADVDFNETDMEDAPLIAFREESGLSSRDTSQEFDEGEVFFEDDHTVQAAPRALDMALSANLGDAPMPPPTPGLRRTDSGRLDGFELPAGPSQAVTSLDTPPNGLPSLNAERVEQEDDPSLQHGSLQGHKGGVATMAAKYDPGFGDPNFGEDDLEEKSSWLVLLGALAALFVALGVALVVILTQGIKEGQPDTGFFILSTPPSAEVHINGRKQFGQTPMVVVDLTAKKKHWVVIRKQGYHAFQRQLSVIEGKTLRINAKLEAIAGQAQGSAEITINTPTGAHIYLDGTRQGITPLLLRNVSIDKKHVIVVRKEGFKEHTETLDALRAGQKLNLEPMLTPIGKEEGTPAK